MDRSFSYKNKKDVLEYGESSKWYKVGIEFFVMMEGENKGSVWKKDTFNWIIYKILSEADAKNQIYITKRVFNQTSGKRMTNATYYKYINKLIGLGFIHKNKNKRSMYMVNPYMFSFGKDSYIDKLKDSWDLDEW